VVATPSSPARAIKAYQFYPAVIHSAARLTYTEVADILGNTKGPEAAPPAWCRT
jgi:exoribonuclease R